MHRPFCAGERHKAEVRALKKALAAAEAKVQLLQTPGPCHGTGSPTSITADGRECVVCLDQPRAARLIPCGHKVLCRECVVGLQECPLCRKPLTDYTCDQDAMTYREWSPH